MLVRFYQNTKRNRSTALPTGQYKEVDVKLKDMTSITSPTLLLSSFAPVFYNYVEIMEWSRYYFISSSASVEGMWEVSLTEDYLASARAYILNTVANILYATESNKNIPDTRIPVTANIKTAYEKRSLGFSLSYANMRYILGITGKGSFGAYILNNNNQLSELLDGIDDWASFITDNWTFTKQLFFGGSASECLRSAIGIPIPFNKSDHGDLEELNLGSYPCMDGNGNAIKGYKITDPILDYGTSITIPWIYNDWRNISAYTDVCLYIPLIGLINLPATEIRNEVSLTIQYKINITSGDIAVEIFGETTRKKYLTASSNCAMPVAFGSTGIDTNKVTQAAVVGVGTLAAVSAATGGLGGILAGIAEGSILGNTAIGMGILSAAGSIMQALGGTASGSAGLGGGAACALDDEVYCFVVSKELAAPQSNYDPIMGKPFMQVDKVGNHRGFIQTDGFQLSSDFLYSSEKDHVNQLMDSGVYIE